MGKFTIIMVCPCNAPINGLPQDGKGVGGGGGGGGVGGSLPMGM